MRYGEIFHEPKARQLSTCQYNKACTCTLIVDYTEENVADALITGLADPEIKQGLLGEPNQPLSMERAMLYVESKEAAKASVSQLDPGISVGAMKGTSKYKKLPRQGRPQPEVEDNELKCYFCGRTGHGKYPSLPLRSAECKAFGHTCGKCGKANHADKVCKSKPSPTQATETAIFDNVCDITTRGAMCWTITCSTIQWTLDYPGLDYPDPRLSGSRTEIIARAYNDLRMRVVENYYVYTGVHNAKAEECTTPYMRQNIKINIGVGGLHGNQGY